MKREAVGHTKMKRLCRRLDIPLWQGVGLLESLWHLTAREAPRGNIGKLSNEDIALGIDYRGDEGKLLEALVETGWLDRHPVERLIVHDWSDHADDAIHARLARTHAFFSDGRVPKLVKLTLDERRAAKEFYDAAAKSADSRGSASEAHETAANRNGRQPGGRPTAESGSGQVQSGGLPEPSRTG